MPITPPIAHGNIDSAAWGIPITNEVNRLTALTAVTAWTAVTFANGWANVAGHGTVQYRKIGDEVELRGRMAAGTMQNTAFTLPAGFRPAAIYQFPVASADAGGNWIFGQIEVQTTGIVKPSAGTNTAIAFGALTFSTIA